MQSADSAFAGELRITSPDDLAAMVVAASQHVPHYCPFIRAALAGHLAVVAPMRDGAISAGRLKRISAPVAVILGDDDGLGTGPDGWACAERVLRWAHHIVVHAAAGKVEDYAGLVEAARITGRLVLIECGTANVGEWNRAAAAWGRKAVMQTLIPPPGCVHPAPFARENMQ